MTSLITNAAASVALMTLRAVSRDLDATSQRVSTGLRIGAASDGAAYWSIATSLRTDNGSLDAVRASLGLVGATVDVTARRLDRVIEQLGVVSATLVSAMSDQVNKRVLQDQIRTALGTIKSISDDTPAIGANWLSVNTEDPDFSPTSDFVLGFSRQGGRTVPITTPLDTSSLILFDDRPRNSEFSYFSPVPAAGSLGATFGKIAAKASVPQPDGYQLSTWDGPTTSGSVTRYLTWNYGFLDTQYYVHDGNRGMTPFSIASIDLATDDADRKMVRAYAAVVDATREDLLDAASTLGATSNLLSSQAEFTRRLMGVNSRSIGTLVDADVEEEAVRLKALQI